ncbi:MAG: hypothetical protein GKR91_18890 [Pseudomonadales bacterium]|nr:hypothetical protein [Pseudomonadales bacterium]
MNILSKSSRLSLVLIVLLNSQTLWANLTDELYVVGEARLKVLLWKIYDSSLYSRTGQYSGVEPELTLQINYLRNIRKNQLLGRTEKEWQRLSVNPQNIEQWSMELAEILPDVKRGETLTLQVEENLSSSFYYTSEFLGNINDPDFTEAFLSIWLSERSSYPELQAQLIGSNSQKQF